MSELEYCAFCAGGYAHSGICDKCATEIEQTGKELADKDKRLAGAQAEIESKNRLIEQMREAISDVLRHAEPPQHDIRGCMRANCWWCQVIRVRDAALSAAERGE